jgi:uncharacterized protein
MFHVRKAALALAAVTSLSVPAFAQQTNLKMATIAPGTSPYLTMTTMATLVNQALPDLNIQVDATGAATKHMVDVAQGNLDFAMTSPNVYLFMKNGQAMYKDLPDAPQLAEKLNLVFWFPLGQYHFVTYADSGIATLPDIKGKQVFLGPPGSGAYNGAATIIELMTGLKPEVDYTPVNASWSSALQGFQDHQFDVYTALGIAPFPALEQIALTSKMHILGLTKAEFDANTAFQDHIRNTPGEEIGIIPAGIYGEGADNAEDVYTMAGMAGVTVRSDLDEETVYKVTKAFWEAAAGATSGHPWLEKVTLEIAIRDGGMKLHPGALRYYKEIGLSIPEGSM